DGLLSEGKSNNLPNQRGAYAAHASDAFDPRPAAQPALLKRRTPGRQLEIRLAPAAVLGVELHWFAGRGSRIHVFLLVFYTEQFLDFPWRQRTHSEKRTAVSGNPSMDTSGRCGRAGMHALRQSGVLRSSGHRRNLAQ